MPESPFLALSPSAHVAANELAFAIRDAYPVSPGHTLVVPRRLVETWFDATKDEQHAILALVDEVRRQLDAELRPDGYNVGFNAGGAAGQTVPHLHVHVIPRFDGDVPDPRGGVRHVIPDKGNYLQKSRPPLATGGTDPFARHILPLLERAREVAIVAAFVQQTGLVRIGPAVDGALGRGARIRLIAGDYLNITQVEALETLLDWQSATGALEVRVVEAGRPGQPRSFHPKSWRFEGDGFAVAYVGSSNLSRQALDEGIEWNLRVDRDRQPAAYERVREAFEGLWTSARTLDAAWIADYAKRVRAFGAPLPAGEVDGELVPVPDPHRVQAEALSALQKSRADGRHRALVVLATGLGKTWLAAFDYRQLWDEIGRPPRILFLAHRREILRQAAATYRQILHERGQSVRISWFLEDEGDLSGHLVFASVAKLSRPAHLARLDPRQFDYVVVDEAHHSDADSYRRILARLEPGFLLGLTATPDRADAADILGLFDDHVAFRAGISDGIAIRRLVPFHYFGVKDDIDYASIPWRNRRFDPQALAEAAQTDARMRTLWSAWSAHPGTRTLVFCCSVEHALYVRNWLRERGVRVAAVFSDARSDDREEALQALSEGRLDALCAIDVFNEGVDLPALDRVVLLRPTESGVVFLQQLGRGLRAAEGKDALTVIDFVGNHRVFLERLRTLLSLGSDRPHEPLAALLQAGEVALPDGCAVELQLEAKDVLEAMFRVGGADNVERAYRELRVARDRRPTAGELYRMGFTVSTLRTRHGGWFRFVGAEGDLSRDEQTVLGVAGSFLDDLEISHMDKSFKMITLEALIEEDRLVDGLDVRAIARRAWSILHRSPELLADVPDEHTEPSTDPAEFPADGGRAEPGGSSLGRRERAWVAYWRKNPIEAWTSSKKKARTWFRLQDDRLLLDLPLEAGLRPAFTEMVRELVDYRLAQYRRRKTVPADGFACKVLSNQRDPILKLDRRAQAIPEGEADVRLPDGSVWTFRFMKEFCNVARPVGTPTNQLPDLLRRWFGPQAGQPGTAFEVRFVASPDGLWVEPLRTNVIPFPRRAVVAYPDLRAAAGHATGDDVAVDAERVLLPVEGGEDVFAVRVSGTSMDGGRTPLRDGDWAIFQLCRGASAAAVEGRVALVEVPTETNGRRYQIKRVKREGDGWKLTSDNPEGPTFEADEDMTVIARLERGVRPEDLGPAVGTVIPEDGLSEAFGIEGLRPVSGRQGGHLFVVLEPGMLERPNRVRWPGARRPGETAYVLGPVDGGVRYLGVGRLTDEELWAIPEVDFAAWRAFGSGREASRELPEGALERAKEVVERILAMPQPVRLVRGDSVGVVQGRSAKGGLRIAGEGPGGFAERTVSLLDIAWVLVAEEDVREKGGLLDEERVNRLRYLPGTPKASTRWIDTGWALATCV